VKINNLPLAAVADPGSYLAIRRVWQDGDTISIGLPMELRQEALPGDDSVAAVLYGPLVLAADMGPIPADGRASDPQRRYRTGRCLRPIRCPKRPQFWIRSLINGSNGIQIGAALQGSPEMPNIELMPMYQIRDQRYSVYWQIENPKTRNS
jgi:hypothetical protein